ncbi:hypothetical protein GCM10009677_54040 [Sphaerisporangium rubeum]|uniref:Uncharacterized protein n=1 Tax=Sphaerisporangium rubeum TaxID=321317 RepID=A0A7X0IGJ5_9ACTN|nr:hypothetical protein [Sphaerisporangium rubeum]MBB6474742.1 hypothetical protein [Sphaerisporangium rubeum]
MEGLTIAILALTLLSTVGFGWMTRRGSLAQAPVTAEFPLAPLAAAHIAGVAALTAKERSSREPVDVMRTDDGYRVEVGCRAGVMTFDIVGLGEGSRCRVEARAGDLTQIGLPDIGGIGVPATDVLHLRVGMPRNAAKLVRRRHRVFRALTVASARDAAYGDVPWVVHV